MADGARRVVQINRQESPYARPGDPPPVEDAVRHDIVLASTKTLAALRRLRALFAIDNVDHLRTGMSVGGRSGPGLKQG